MFHRAFFSNLRKFDAYPKTLDDFRIKTCAGAAITIISGVIMTLLFWSEFIFFMTNEIQPELFVDVSKGQKLKINLNITFHHIGCSFLTIDAMDVSGEQQIDVDHNIYKLRIDNKGFFIDDSPQKEGLNTVSTVAPLDPNRCESCYGAETVDIKCCNTCDDVREAYRRRGWAFSIDLDIEQCKRDHMKIKIKQQLSEGCIVFGYLEVNKVAGNFHMAPGVSFSQNHMHVHDMQAIGTTSFNTSHTVNHLSFGEDYPGQNNPLDGSVLTAHQLSTMFHYYVKVVPTTYSKLNGETIYTNQYSVTKHTKIYTTGFFGDSGLPGIFFTYELSPMMVKYTEKRRSFTHFLTGVCAIVGGVFTVAGLFDSLLYHSSRAIQKKMELGKAS
ncbi:hypothetical protein HELRODRAFT_105492 [Helobdella robusta]|uniref:Endoplasmic reticulum-Golgi intermediate compartment protein 3 n=1 Tax=Helobdella robusta TaxID=6412 RepID=T1EDV6_HELRO|nr:hypothetical protein HELRODRAFT_105492 [Helobdella robusta]ESO12742.1 hypothetical protein HELRODRAFT_105492 [Helobdella robusta]